MSSLLEWLQDPTSFHAAALPATGPPAGVATPSPQKAVGLSSPSLRRSQVSDTTAAFITCLDSVRLNMLAVDQLQPSLNDLMSALNKARSPLPQALAASIAHCSEHIQLLFQCTSLAVFPHCIRGH